MNFKDGFNKMEYSFGAVVYRINENNEIEFLLEHMTLGHTSIPKGHIEEGETVIDCVRREIKEELNIEINLDMNFRHTIKYSPKPGIMKEVTFFSATPKTFDIITQKEEVLSISWATYKKSLILLTHDLDKEVITDAYEYIKKKEGLL